MSNKLLLIINWLFGSTFTAWIGMLMTEMSTGVKLNSWLTTGTAIAVFLLACTRLYDWAEKKCRRNRRYKKLKKK